jgi:hypothetical protein
MILATGCQGPGENTSSLDASARDFSTATLAAIGDIVSRNCMECHNDKNPLGQVSFEDPEKFFAAETQIRATIDAGEMPKGRTWMASDDKERLYELMASPDGFQGGPWPTVPSSSGPATPPPSSPSSPGTPPPSGPSSPGTPPPSGQGGQPSVPNGGTVTCGPGEKKTEQTPNGVVSCDSSGNGSSSSSVSP